MSAQPDGGGSGPSILPGRYLIAGCFLFVVTLAAWLYGSQTHLDTTVVWVFATPVIGALFLAGPVSRAASSATQAAIQTNGSLGDRVEAAVTTALAKRDMQRTAQSVSPLPVTSAGNQLDANPQPSTTPRAIT